MRQLGTLARQFLLVATLPLIREDLLPRAEFHSEIAGWIDLSYRETYRSELNAVADILLAERLEPCARRLLEQRGFIIVPTQSESWEDHVRRSNMRV